MMGYAVSRVSQIHQQIDNDIPPYMEHGREPMLMVDPECCDGSDEWQTGACPNQCEEIGRTYREKVEAETKTRKTVSPCSLGFLKLDALICGRARAISPIQAACYCYS